MTATIFNFELQYWERNPLAYVFGFVLFVLPLLTIWGMSAEANVGDNLEMMNSYYKLNSIAQRFSLLLIFLLPAIFGNSVFRDYSNRMHTLLYSFPFSKRDYLLAKFSSALFVVFCIVIALSLGLLLGTVMPGVKQEVILPLDINNYLQLIFFYLMPNMIFFGIVALALTLHTRNIYVSFIGVICMIIVQSFGKGLLAANGYDMMAALADPTGEASIKYVVRYWTLEERNLSALPISGAMLYNRLFWLTITIVIAIWSYLKFEFNQFVSSGRRTLKRRKLEVLENKVTFISVPKAIISSDMPHKLRTAWHLSTIDFRSIITSWSFITILFAGGVLVLFQQYQMGPQEGIVSIPTTSNMLRFPMFFFSAIVNLLTFLYAGVLMYRSELARMGGLIDSSPVPNWVLLSSRLIALFKMQFVLLLLVLVGGVVAQILAGYYRFEWGHYIFELYILQAVHFMAWACLALCIHSITKNMYLGYFLLMLVPVYNLLLPALADYIDWDILKNSLFQFNAVQGIFLGFEYSEFNGYGSQLITYFAYKFYWILCSIGLILIALLCWKRGYTFTISERYHKARSRCKGHIAFALLVGFIAYVATGFNIYHQENHVSKTIFSDRKVQQISVDNEKKFGHLEQLIQPRLADVKLAMDIFPEDLNFQAAGVLTYVNRTEYPIDTIVIAKSLKEITKCLVQQDHTIIAKDDLLQYEVILLDSQLWRGDSLVINISITNFENTFLHHNSRVIKNGTYITSHILPVLGIRNAFLSSKKERKKFGLGDREPIVLMPSDTTLLGHGYSGNNQGLITYDCVMSTHRDQTPITMGAVKKRWTNQDRNFYHYKSDGHIVNTLSWMSGSYERLSESGKHQQLEMYRHPKQDYNDEHFFHGLNASIDYCSDWFGPLTYDTLRIVEFPETEGTYATVNGNLIPYSESYFKCDVHDHDNDAFNMPFFVSAHEIAHCWWGHRVDPANVLGGRMITEGMADYIAMKSIEQEYEIGKVLTFRKKYHEIYLEERARQSNETPLIHSSLKNEYLNYRKASLAIYAMSEYLGEDVLNAALAKFESRYKYADPPFPTSLDFIDYIREATPDSLQYLIYDLFETITLYDNNIGDVEVEINNDVSTIHLALQITKYRSDKRGKRTYGDAPLREGDNQSLPLSDYIEIGFFDENSLLLNKQMVHITTINSTHEFEVKGQVKSIVLDPNYLLFAVDRDGYTSFD